MTSPVRLDFFVRSSRLVPLNVKVSTEEQHGCFTQANRQQFVLSTYPGRLFSGEWNRTKANALLTGGHLRTKSCEDMHFGSLAAASRSRPSIQ